MVDALPTKTVTLSFRKLRAAETAAAKAGISVSDYLNLPRKLPKQSITLRLSAGTLEVAEAKAEDSKTTLRKLLVQVIEDAVVSNRS